MGYIKLIYWRTDIDNFGDLLSPYLIGRLSGKPICQKNYFVGNKKSHLYHTLCSILKLDFKFRAPYLQPYEQPILGIGSILSYGNGRARIWGSGFMRESERCNGGKVYAVRGLKSLAILKKQIAMGDKIDIVDNVAIGDPGLLAPLLVSPTGCKQYRVGIIPHFSETEYFNEKYGDKFHIIDLRSADIEGIIRDINECIYVYSSSLHGMIIAHAYKIPALWIEHIGLEKGTNGFKFLDYFTSVGIDPYMPLRNLSEVLEDEEKALSYFTTFSAQTLPHVDLSEIQQNLLRVAPFTISSRNHVNM